MLQPVTCILAPTKMCLLLGLVIITSKFLSSTASCQASNNRQSSHYRKVFAAKDNFVRLSIQPVSASSINEPILCSFLCLENPECTAFLMDSDCILGILNTPTAAVAGSQEITCWQKEALGGFPLSSAAFTGHSLSWPRKSGFWNIS